METKKQKERAIFDAVYADRPILSVTPSEEPDFRVINADGEFGVEITEFYFSASEARLKNIPTYFNEILEQKKYRHKDDFVPLEVKELTIQPNDGRPNFQVEGLLQEMPTIREYVAKISALIEHKNTLFGKYSVGLSHVNLIIRDYEHRLVGISRDNFHYFLFQPALDRRYSMLGFEKSTSSLTLGSTSRRS